MLDAEVVSNNTVDASTAIIEIVVGQDNEDGVSSHLTLDEDCVATEELESLHGVV
jgi:hypothetical protein